ncbi:hypothetical protein GBAR_LOCUS17192 [Geodia barretti]|uniref:Secreted protein n=1 Tax=Geodia barretti TaxID=519541 RepID=A0AA35SHP9_GEOBA|nr:hypothetical protein GBAR_LOCUS17192 [Geodia barretti]
MFCSSVSHLLTSFIMSLSFSRVMDFKVPDSVSLLNCNIVTTSNLMNGLPVGECEHRSLFSILVIQEHEFGRGIYVVGKDRTFASSCSPSSNICRDTLHCRHDSYVSKYATVTLLITHNSSSLSPCSATASMSSIGMISESSLAIVRYFVL